MILNEVEKYLSRKVTKCPTLENNLSGCWAESKLYQDKKGSMAIT